MSTPIKCPKCPKRYKSDESACPKCGYAMTNEEKEKAIKFAKKYGKISLVLVGLVIALGLYIFLGGENELKFAGTPQPYGFISDTVDSSGTPGRDKRQLVIGLMKDQDGVTHEDLIATVVEAAKKHHEDYLPIVSVWLMAQNAKSPHATMELAHAVYIPDEKGYNGQQDIGPWDIWC